MTTAYTRRRGARPFGIALAALVAVGAALTGPTLASASSGDLQLGSSQFGSSGEQPPLPEIPPPSAAEIRLDEARNFRDIGGYRTTDGRTVRTGLVFRSNKLSSLNETDLAKLTAANLTLDVDLRNASERAEDPDRIPAGVTYQVADVVSIEHGIAFHEFVPLTLGRALIDGAVKGTSNIGQSIGYPFMVNYRGSDVAFRDLLTAIANNSDGATVYHCSAGKDRTGWGTAILLTILGVPREVISADFMASNTYLGRDDAVDLSWLDAAYAQVDRLYGGMDTYVREGLGRRPGHCRLSARQASPLSGAPRPASCLLGPSAVPVRAMVAGRAIVWRRSWGGPEVSWPCAITKWRKNFARKKHAWSWTRRWPIGQHRIECLEDSCPAFGAVRCTVAETIHPTRGWRTHEKRCRATELRGSDRDR